MPLEIREGQLSATLPAARPRTVRSRIHARSNPLSKRLDASLEQTRRGFATEAENGVRPGRGSRTRTRRADMRRPYGVRRNPLSGATFPRKTLRLRFYAIGAVHGKVRHVEAAGFSRRREGRGHKIRRPPRRTEPQDARRSGHRARRARRRSPRAKRRKLLTRHIARQAVTRPEAQQQVNAPAVKLGARMITSKPREPLEQLRHANAVNRGVPALALKLVTDGLDALIGLGEGVKRQPRSKAVIVERRDHEACACHGVRTVLVVGHENGLDGAQPRTAALKREIAVETAGDDAAAARIGLVPDAAAHHARNRLAAPHGRAVKREAQYRPQHRGDLFKRHGPGLVGVVDGGLRRRGAAHHVVGVLALARQIAVHDLAALLGDELHVLGADGDGVVAADHEVGRAAEQAHDALELGVEGVNGGKYVGEVGHGAGGDPNLRARLGGDGDGERLGRPVCGRGGVIGVREAHEVAVDVDGGRSPDAAP